MQYTYPAYTTTEDRKRKSRGSVLPILAGVVGLAGLGAGAYLLSKSLKSPSGTGSLGGGGGAGIGARPDNTPASTPFSKIIPVTSTDISNLPANLPDYRKALHSLDTRPAGLLQADRTIPDASRVEIKLDPVQPTFQRLQNVRDNTALLRARLKVIDQQHTENIQKEIAARKIAVPQQKQNLPEAIKAAEDKLVQSKISRPEGRREVLSEIIEAVSASNDLQKSDKLNLRSRVLNADQISSAEAADILKEIKENTPYSPSVTAGQIREKLQSILQAPPQSSKPRQQEGVPRAKNLLPPDVIDVTPEVIEVAPVTPATPVDVYVQSVIESFAQKSGKPLSGYDKARLTDQMVKRLKASKFEPIATATLEKGLQGTSNTPPEWKQKLQERANRRENKTAIATEIIRAAEQARDERIKGLYEAALDQGTITKIAQAQNAQDTTLVGRAKETLQEIGQKVSQAIGISQPSASIKANLDTDDVKQIVRAELDDVLYRTVTQRNSPFNIENEDYSPVIRYLNRQIARTTGSARKIYENYLNSLLQEINTLEENRVAIAGAPELANQAQAKINTARQNISRTMQDLSDLQQRYLKNVGQQLGISDDIGVEGYVRGVIRNNRALSTAARQPEASIYPVSAIVLAQTNEAARKAKKAVTTIQQQGLIEGAKRFIQDETSEASQQLVEGVKQTAANIASQASKQAATTLGITESQATTLRDIMAKNYEVTQNPMYYITREGLNPQLQDIAMQKKLSGGDTSIQVTTPQDTLSMENIQTQQVKNLVTPRGAVISRYVPIIDSTITQGGQRVLMLRYPNPDNPGARNVYRLRYFSAPTKTLAKFGVV